MGSTLSKFNLIPRNCEADRAVSNVNGNNHPEENSAENSVQLFPDGGINGSIPLELLEIVFEQCDFATQIKIQRVCRRWYSAGRMPQFLDTRQAILDLQILLNLTKANHLKQLEEHFAAERAGIINVLIVQGNTPWKAQEWDNIHPVSLDATPRIPHPLLGTIARLVAEGQCPNLQTVHFSGIRICLTTSPEFHKIHQFVPGTVTHLQFQDINVVVAFLELPVLVIRAFHVNRFSIDLTQQEDFAQRKRRIASGLLDLASFAVRQHSETQAAAVKPEQLPPDWTTAVLNYVSGQSRSCLGLYLCKILTFRLDPSVNTGEYMKQLCESASGNQTIRTDNFSPLTMYALHLYKEYSESGLKEQQLAVDRSPSPMRERRFDDPNVNLRTLF